jgi:hypothetical protein
LKKVVLVLGALMVLAAPVCAYVQPGSLGSPAILKEGAGKVPKEQSDGAGSGLSQPDYRDIPVTVEPVSDEAVKPVPEPATMAMASMGLLAVGAALRKRRSH